MKHAKLITAAVATAALTAACGGGDNPSSDSSTESATEPMKVMLFPGLAYTLPYTVADEKGFFEEVGIDVEQVDQPTSLPGAQGLQATKADASLMSVVTASQGWQSGIGVQGFCGGYQHIQSDLMAPKGTDLPKVSEGADWQEVLGALDGKTIGTETPTGSGVQLIVDAALTESGVEDQTYVTVGTNAGAVGAALEQGSVDAAVTNPPLTQLLESRGAESLMKLKDGPELYKEDYNVMWVGVEEWVEKEPEQAEAFCDAIGKALDYVHDDANAEELSDLLASKTEMQPDIAASVIESGFFDEFDTAIPQDAVEATLSRFVDIGVLEASPEPTYDALVEDHS